MERALAVTPTASCEPSDAERISNQRMPSLRRDAVGDRAPGSWERLRLTGTDRFA